MVRISGCLYMWQLSIIITESLSCHGFICPKSCSMNVLKEYEVNEPSMIFTNRIQSRESPSKIECLKRYFILFLSLLDLRNHPFLCTIFPVWRMPFSLPCVPSLPMHCLSRLSSNLQYFHHQKQAVMAHIVPQAALESDFVGRDTIYFWWGWVKALSKFPSASFYS